MDLFNVANLSNLRTDVLLNPDCLKSICLVSNKRSVSEISFGITEDINATI